MKLDLKLLSAHFLQARESPAVSNEGVSEYLLEHFLKPYVREEKPVYGDLDYDAFDDDDLRVLWRYCEALEEAGNKLNRLSVALSEAAPEACRRRAFC